jgi:vitamin B12 transporter
MLYSPYRVIKFREGIFMSMVKSLSTSILMTVLITGSWSGLALAAAAADTTEPTYTLDEVVVTATRTENKKVDTPANVTVVDAKKIEERSYKDVVEVMRDVPGAQVSSTGTYGYERIIRLNGDERVLVLVDGKRVNTNIGTMGRSTFDANTIPPIDAIEKIEIVKGAGSSLYGSDAVGGTINIITKKATHNYGTVKAGFGSWGAQNYGVSYAGKQGKTGFMISADRERQSFAKYKNYVTGETIRWKDPNNYDQEKLSLKIDQELTADTALGLTYDYAKLDGNAASDAVHTYGANPVDKHINNVGLKYDWGVTRENKGYARIYRDYYGYDNQGEISESTIGLDVQQQVKTSDKNKVVFGTSLYKANAYNEIAFSEGESINNKALFVQDEWQFAPSWQLNAGLRYDNHSEAGSKTTASIAMNKKFNENSHAYLSWGQIFKAPNIDDLYYSNTTWGYYGDKNLKPETGDQWNLGYDVATSASTTLGINVFYSELKDVIDWGEFNPVTYETHVENKYKQRRRGLELTANHKLNDNFDLAASYNYVKVESKNSDADDYTRDGGYVPNTFKMGIKYHNNKWNVELLGRAMSGADTNATNKYGAQYYLNSHFFTMDLDTKYKINKNLGAYVNIYNLTNAAYVEQGGVASGWYRYPMQGRRFMAGVTYTF